MPLPHSKNSSWTSPFSGSNAGTKRDILWDRPVFRPPQLPNPRVIFDPLPFTAQRVTQTARHAVSH